MRRYRVVAISSADQNGTLTRKSNHFDACLLFIRQWKVYVLPRFSYKTRPARRERWREGEMNKRKLGSFALCVMLLALCASAEAQQTGKIFRIGFLDNSTASGIAVLLEAFRQELSKLGWIEGKNITIEYRFAEQKNERLPELAADLVRLKVDLIVVSWRRRR